MDSDDFNVLFAEMRPVLMGLAYRMLGSRAEAEDAVQDAFVKWQLADRTAIENLSSWLTTACTRRCIDLLRSARRKRVDYVGAWLPEPIQSDDGEGFDLALATSLSTAFLLMLERLTPRERAAYLLNEVFELSHAEVARILGITEVACRKLVSRAAPRRPGAHPSRDAGGQAGAAAGDLPGCHSERRHA